MTYQRKIVKYDPGLMS